MYRKKFLDRGVNYIEYEEVPEFRLPTVEEEVTLETVTHIWKTGDRLYKLAHQHYGDPSLWWVIAFYNAKPTEAYYAQGTVVEIPKPLDRVLRYMGY